MDEEITIIDTKTRNEKIKNFFIQNKNKLITTLILLILILISFLGFQEYRDLKAKKISEEFNLVITDYENGKLDLIKERLKEIVIKEDSTYSPLSLYFIIDNDLAESRDEINKLFDVLIKKTPVEEEIRNLIIYKKALFNADDINEYQLLDMLKPIINSDSIWKSHALYLLAEFFYSNNEKQKSKEFYDQIIVLKNANQDIVKDTVKRLNRDLSE